MPLRLLDQSSMLVHQVTGREGDPPNLRATRWAKHALSRVPTALFETGVDSYVAHKNRRGAPAYAEQSTEQLYGWVCASEQSQPAEPRASGEAPSRADPIQEAHP